MTREIDLALHLEGISLLALDARSGLLVDPRQRTRRLDASSELALTLSNASAPLEVDLESPHSPFLKLPLKERQCLADGGFRLLVPILARDGSLLGLIGLGEKKSGLPFLKEDRQLLHAIASNAAWVLELEVAEGAPPTPGAGPHEGRGSDAPRDPLGLVRARQGVPEVRRAPPVLHRLLQHLQQEARAVGRALHAAGEVPLRAADRHRRHGSGLQRVRLGARPPRGDQDPAPDLQRGRPAAAARGADRGRGLPPPPRPRSSAWRPGRGCRC